jgi:hypothetical protein
MINKMLAHCAGFFLGIIRFFGITHGLVALTVLTVGLFHGVAFAPMIGMALAIGAGTALIDTFFSMFWNKHIVPLIWSIVEDKLDERVLEEGVLTYGIYWLEKNYCEELNTPFHRKKQELISSLKRITPIGEALLFGIAETRAHDTETYTEEDMKNTRKYLRSMGLAP